MSVKSVIDGCVMMPMKYGGGTSVGTGVEAAMVGGASSSDVWLDSDVCEDCDDVSYTCDVKAESECRVSSESEGSESVNDGSTMVLVLQAKLTAAARATEIGERWLDDGVGAACEVDGGSACDWNGGGDHDHD